MKSDVLALFGLTVHQAPGFVFREHRDPLALERPTLPLFPPTQVSTERRAEPPVLYCRFPPAIRLFSFGCAGSSCFTSPVLARRGYSLVVVRRLLIVLLLWLWSTGSRAHGLSGSTACGVFWDQGSNPSPLHW